MIMMCPNCKKETSCGCKSCAKRPAKFKRNIMKADTIECPHCQFKSSYEIWEYYEYTQYDLRKDK